MGFNFSEYVRSLDPLGKPPDWESFDAAMRLLGRALRREMKKRGLWTAPPGFLGVQSNSWEEDGVFTELLQDCYTAIFIERLPALMRRLLVHSNIDGVIVLNIRHFLNGRQKQRDPVGYRVFGMLKSAVERSMETGGLHVLQGDARVRNDTILGFEPWADPLKAQGTNFDQRVETWNDVLLPELITAWGRGRTKVLNTLQSFIAQLHDDGVDAFRFRDLITPLKNDARRRWWEVWRHEEGETVREGDDDSSLTWWVLPNIDFEEQQSFDQLLACVDKRFEKLKERKKTLEYLWRLWEFQRCCAAEDGESRPPSNLKLSRLLNIPYDRIQGLKATLGGLIGTCRKAILGIDEVNEEERGFRASLPGAAPSCAKQEGVTDMRQKDRRQLLRQQTGEAAARFAEVRARIERNSTRPPQPGDIFILEETSAVPVEWVIVDRDPEDRHRLWVVPADTNPLVGSRDVVVNPQDAGGLSSLRCGLGVWLEDGVFDPKHRSGILPAEVLSKVHAKHIGTGAGAAPSSIRERELDDDPEYREWIGDELKARATLLSRLSMGERSGNLLELSGQPGNDRDQINEFDSPDEQRARGRSPLNYSRWGSLSSPYGIAASVALALTLGLFGGAVWKRQDLEDLERARQLLEARTESLIEDLEQSSQARSDLMEKAQQQERRMEELEQQDATSSLRIAAIERELETTRRQEPELDLPFVFFSHEEPVRGSGAPVVLPAGARRLALVFEVVDFEPYSGYRLQILEEETGREAWRSDLLTKRRSELSLDLPRSIFRSGDYIFQVYGLHDDEPKLLERYSLSLRLEYLSP